MNTINIVITMHKLITIIINLTIPINTGDFGFLLNAKLISDKKFLSIVINFQSIPLYET